MDKPITQETTEAVKRNIGEVIMNDIPEDILKYSVLIDAWCKKNYPTGRMHWEMGGCASRDWSNFLHHRLIELKEELDEIRINTNQLKYTKNRPTRPGFYWIKLPEIGMGFITDIEYTKVNDGFLEWNDGDHWFPVQETDPDVEWAGPIIEPTE